MNHSIPLSRHTVSVSADVAHLLRTGHLPRERATWRDLLTVPAGIALIALLALTALSAAATGAYALTRSPSTVQSDSHDSRIIASPALPACVAGAEQPPCAGPDYIVLGQGGQLPLTVDYPDTGDVYYAPAPTMPTCELATSAGPCAWDTGEASTTGQAGTVYAHTPDGHGGCWEVAVEASDDAYPVHYDACD